MLFMAASLLVASYYFDGRGSFGEYFELLIEKIPDGAWRHLKRDGQSGRGGYGERQLEIYKDCHFPSANRTWAVVSKNATVNVVWLHGLGGHGDRVYKKMEFSKSISKYGSKFSWFFPTAKLRNTTWNQAGLTTSWFTLDNISTSTTHPTAEITSHQFKNFIECIKSSSSSAISHTIIGGASQGGATAWLTARRFYAGDPAYSFILANTWLPSKIKGIKSNQHQSSNNLHVIYNKFDDVVGTQLVKSSIALSSFVGDVSMLQNSTSLHSVDTDDHRRFVHNLIDNKFH